MLSTICLYIEVNNVNIEMLLNSINTKIVFAHVSHRDCENKIVFKLCFGFVYHQISSFAYKKCNL